MIASLGARRRAEREREREREGKGRFFLVFRSVDSAVLGSSNEAAWVAAPVPPSPGSSRLKFCAFFLLGVVPFVARDY